MVFGLRLCVGDSLAHPAIECDSCGHTFCFTHDDAHAGLTCEQYSKQLGHRIRQELKASDRLIYRTTKSCPHCGSATEKSGGCNHM